VRQKLIVPGTIREAARAQVGNSMTVYRRKPNRRCWRMMLLLSFMAPIASAVAQTPDEATISHTAKRLKERLKAEGMNGVGRDVQKCYDEAGDAAMKIKECMLYDGASFRLDKGMQGALAMRGESLGQTRYFADQAYGMRLNFYGTRAFGMEDTDALASLYLVRPSAEVMRRAVK
jgi:hypothetical protein